MLFVQLRVSCRKFFVNSLKCDVCHLIVSVATTAHVSRVLSHYLIVHHCRPYIVAARMACLHEWNMASRRARMLPNYRLNGGRCLGAAAMGAGA